MKENKGDLISREALKAEIINNFDNLQAYFPKDFIEEINNAPTVNYPFYQEAYQTGYEEGKNERPQGEWIKMAFDDKTIFYCSECHSHFEYPFNFCPNCGVEMQKR